MKKVFAIIALSSLFAMFMPVKSLAAGGIYASGGGKKTVGETFTVNVTASGATFDTVSGSISVSGPVSVVGFSAGDCTWINKPTENGSFNGAFLGQKKDSFTIATIKLKGTSPGNGAVNISGASLKNAGAVVGTGAGSAGFTIEKAPDLPGAPKVSSSSHPDPAAAYEDTTIVLSWEKASGVDAFSYLLDQAEKTTPPAKTTDANTTVTYTDQAIGTYYFHIRAHKADGWGGTTHFQINIKEPDAKIDPTLSAPSNIEIKKTSSFINDIQNGTVSGIIISGVTEIGYTVTLTLTPPPTVPEGKTLTAIADTTGKWEILIDYPIASGFHKLIVQGQKEKVLTPLSDEVVFEISQKEGGIINILTAEDEFAPVKAAETPEKSLTINRNLLFCGIGGVFLIILIVLLVNLIKKRRRHNSLAKAIKN